MRFPTLFHFSQPMFGAISTSTPRAAASSTLAMKVADVVEDESTTSNTYTPPKVWKWDTPDPEAGNQPTAGARFQQTLPVGEHPLQLYSLATPNGQKVSILLEELLEIGKAEAEYDAWPIKIFDKDQFGSDFVDINPNSKIPALVDKSNADDIKVFESGSILLYLAEKFENAFLPKDLHKRTQTLNWLFWQVGSAPFLGGGFGHFYHYAAPEHKTKYPIDRFTMETKRQLDVLNQHLAKNKFMVGDDYTIADIAIWPWYGGVVLGKWYGNAAEFLNVQEEYPHVIRWAKEIDARPAVQRGIRVNLTWGPIEEQLPERHSAKDFE